MKYEQWYKNPIRFRAMTGYTTEQYDWLYPYFEEAHNDYYNRQRHNGKKQERRRAYAIYKNSPLNTIHERLVFILSYLKLNPLQEQHADLFNMSQQHCNEFVHHLKEILDIALSDAEMMPAQNQKELEAKLSQEFSDETKDKILLHDGTEREIPRPADEDDQKEKYSGKKKKHTVKNAVITTVTNLILFVSITVAGNVHDKKIADQYYRIPAPYTLWQDTGYQGYRPDGVQIKQPRKKPRGKPLSDEQKAENSKISSFRVRVEHAIGDAKKMRIVKDECRLRKNNFPETVFATAAAIHNIRVTLNPPKYKN